MTQKKRVTISEVARAANVSPATVSRILNHEEGSIKISQETQERVLEAIRNLGYRRNPFAFALRAERTGIVGAIVRNLRGGHINLVASQLQAVARRRGIEVLISGASLQPENIGNQLDLFQSQLFDGLLLVGDSANFQPALATLHDYTKPVVCICNSAFSPLVNVDDAQGVRLVLEHLMEMGHRKIAFVGQPEQQGSLNRLAAFQAHLRSIDPALLLPEYIIMSPEASYRPEDLESVVRIHFAARQAASELAKLDEPPTAIFCSNDTLAIGVMRGLHQQGLRVPTDISVAGFDDIIQAACADPALTTIRQPREKMAEEALQLLLQLIEHPEDPALSQKTILVPPTLIARDSTGLVRS